MQYDPEATQPVQSRPNRTRLVGMQNKQPISSVSNEPPQTISEQEPDIAMQPTISMHKLDDASFSDSETPHPPYDLRHALTDDPFNINVDVDISDQITAHIMRLSGQVPIVRVTSHTPRAIKVSNAAQRDQPATSNNTFDNEDGYWPYGIQQTGPLPVVNLYGNEPFGRIMPDNVAPLPAPQAKPWKTFLGKPAVKVTIGLLIGIGLLFLLTRVVDIPDTIQVLKKNLATPRGIMLALLSGVAFVLAFSIRGVRWKLFLNPIGKVSTLKAIQLFLVGVFLNFLLPIRGGEVAKSLMLKRIASIPVSQSLPTVAMDKALDLMPALFIMAIVPLLGVQMSTQLWLVLGLVGGLLIGLIFFIALAAWKRTAAIQFLQKVTGLLPKGVASKIEGFATGFVDSLLIGASRPRIFVPALLLTVVAVIFDGLFAMLAFWTVGYPIPFGTAIFGYSVYNMFYILPNPPGQVGSNEIVGLLVFSGLLHLPASSVTAMFIFSHPWAALLQCAIGMACLSALGLNISSAMKVQTGGEDVALQGQGAPA
jgi:uncharacterized protein (TIRG00374 family)